MLALNVQVLSCVFVVSTLRQGGNVLLPCNPMGVLYDLLEILGAQLGSN